LIYLPQAFLPYQKPGLAPVIIHFKSIVMELTTIFALIGSLGGAEIFFILLAILLLFGAKKIPDLARGLGKGIREFKDASKEVEKELNSHENEMAFERGKQK
jgi:sec-independent protein translocase protein TatA